MPWKVYSKYVNSPGIYKSKTIPIKIPLGVLPTSSWTLANSLHGTVKVQVSQENLEEKQSKTFTIKLL